MASNEKRKRSESELSNMPPTNWSGPATTSGAVKDESTETGTERDQRFRDLYAKPPDFKELAFLDADFATVIKGRELDFNDPSAVMQLTKTLLQLDFSLHVELPDDRLCPPVTNRHNYILWLKRLLDTTSYDVPGRKLVGLDVGTGASCIYPLLGCSQRPWSFIATDIDCKSIEYAEKNVRLNHLEHRINVVQRKPGDSLLPLDDLGIDSIDFCMTNPPFYQSEEEMLQSASKKSRPPYTACSGATVEMVTEGGEVAFVQKILDESLLLRERVQWYTSMFGFLSSLTHIVEKLQEHGIANYAVTEFVQGIKTRRWAVAWSFRSMRPAQDVARGMKISSKSILPQITEVEITRLPTPENIGEFADRLRSAVEALELISWEWDRERLEGRGRAMDKVWGRAWRRRRKREMEVEPSEKSQLDVGEKHCMFGFLVAIRVTREDTLVECRWTEGHDGPSFESFQGFLKATVQTIQGSKADQN